MNQFHAYRQVMNAWITTPSITMSTNSATCNDTYGTWDTGTDCGTTTNSFIVRDYQTFEWPKPIRRRRRKTEPPPEPVRRPPPLEFNKYINGSDLLEQFIKFLGEHRVRKAQALAMPLELFVKWLIIEAFKADQEEPPMQLTLPTRTMPRCLHCQRFVAVKNPTKLCNALCAQRYFAKAA